MSTKVASLYAEIGADTSGLDKGLGKTKTSIENLFKDTNKLALGTKDLGSKVTDFGNMLKGATPENIKFAQSFKQIQSRFDSGKISIFEAKKQTEELSKSMGLGAVEVKSFGQKFAEGFEAIKMQALAAAGVIAGVGIAVKKAFEWGKEGANIEFTAQKFDRLAESIGTTGEALKTDLKDAMGGLMSDTELMASATDLMALGLVKTHDEAIRLTNVAGQLGMNMNQLVLTLTNQTTMRFDALGVSVAGFQDKVDALKASGMSASDAFNEAFLQQAEEQLAKVGSIADTSAGSIMKMEASIKNLGDAMKLSLAPAVADVAEVINKQITMSMALDDAIKAGIITREEESAMLMALKGGMTEYGDILQWVSNKTADYQATIDPTIGSIYGLMGGTYEAATATEELADAFDTAAVSADKMMDALDIAMTNDLTEAINEQSDALGELIDKIIWKTASENLSAEASLLLAREMGLVDEAAYSLATGVQYLTSVYDVNRDGVIDANEATSGYVSTLATLQGIMSTIESKNVEIVIDIITRGNLGALNLFAPGGLSTRTTNFGFNAIKGNYGFASGADFVVPPGFPNDSYPMRVQSGEHVQVTPAGKGDSNDALMAMIRELPQSIRLAVTDGIQKAVR